jgi:predicted Zn finger-like uncharacterized protein
MILTCPSCGTQYVVKDGAIPPGGRQVRCASCKHSWHQDPEASDAPAEATAPSAEGSAPPPIAEAEPEPEPVAQDEDESFAEATLIEPRSGPEIEERAYEEAAIEGATPPDESGEPEDSAATTYGAAQFDIGRKDTVEPSEDWREPPEVEPQDDEFSPFPAADEIAPRRRRSILTLLVIVLVVAALGAAFWFLAPAEWKAQLGLGAVGTSPLALVTTHMDRQRLESGNELLTVTGRIINPTGKDQDVPPLQAQLKSRNGQTVYRWTIAPPARSLSPGASASFNSAEVNVPPGGETLTISLGSSGA